MQYVFLIRSHAGCKKYVTRLRLVTYFLQPALKRIKDTYCIGKRLCLYLYQCTQVTGEHSHNRKTRQLKDKELKKYCLSKVSFVKGVEVLLVQLMVDLLPMWMWTAPNSIGVNFLQIVGGAHGPFLPLPSPPSPPLPSLPLPLEVGPLKSS